MREKQQVTILMAGVFIIGLAGLYLMGGIPGLARENINLGNKYVDDYRADFFLNGTLNEQFRYKMDGSYLNRISRPWTYPLSFKKLDRPYVETSGFVPIPGTLSYARNWQGDLLVMDEDGTVVAFPDEFRYTRVVNSLAEWDEAGCYNPSYFDVGSEEIGYIFTIHPPLEQDVHYVHWNLLLADTHLPYENSTIRVHDPRGDLVQLFTQPKMATRKVGDTWVMTGFCPQDEALRVEMLLKSRAAKFIDGFPRNVSDVEGKTLSANADYTVSLDPAQEIAPLPETLGSIWVDRYSADVYLNGTLKETFQYAIRQSGKYRMLYRNWKTPLSAEPLNEPYVEPVRVLAPKGTIPYIKDDINGARILAPNGTYYPSSSYELWPYGGRIADISDNNEMGHYIMSSNFRTSLDAGYKSVVHPAILSDDDHSYIRLNLANEHLPYKHLAVTVHDPEEHIPGLFTVPKMDVKRDGTDWVISGSSRQDQPLQIDLLLKSEPSLSMQGFVQPSEDVAAQFQREEASHSWSDLLATAYSIVMRLLVLLAPLILLLVYGRFGKERFFTVPASLSYVPNKRKPWQVNLIFKGDPFDFDKDGFYATILNLHRQDLVEILSDEANDLKIRLLKEPADAEDDYERSVLNFLHKDAVDGVFSYNSFEKKIESLRNRAYNDSTSALNELNEICGNMTDLMAGPGEAFGREFFTNYGKAKAMMAILPMALIAGTGILCLTLADDYPQLYLGFYSAVVFLAQSCLPAFAAPRAFFGRWNRDYYKEKLEWDAFRAFLSDYAMIQKYIPEDISIWKDWLVYGTALGVGKNVVKSMDQLKIPAIPEVHAVTFAPAHFERAYSRSTEHVITKSEIAARERMSSGGSWGGSHSHSGGGGGFGGGGGGRGGGGGGGGHGGGGGGAR